MRKRILIFLSLLLGPLAFASMVILFDPATGRNLRRIDSADTLAYLSRTDCLINPVLPTNALNLCYVTNGAVEVIPQAWLDAEALAAWIAQSNANVLFIATERSNMIATASAYMYGTNAEGRILRAFALLTLDQINTLRKLHSLPVITTNTFLTAMSNSVTADPL